MVTREYLCNGEVDAHQIHAALERMPGSTSIRSGPCTWIVHLDLGGSRKHRIYIEIWPGDADGAGAQAKCTQPALLLHAPIIPYALVHLESAMRALEAHAGLRICRWQHPVRRDAFVACTMSFYLLSLSESELHDGVLSLREQADRLEEQFAAGTDEE